jgi:hypothetical protein
MTIALRELARRLCTAGMMALPLCTPLAAQQQATVERNVNLRPTPSTAQDPKRKLLPPEPLSVLDSNPTGGYYHVLTQQNEDGWVWGLNIVFTTVPAEPAGPPLPAPGGFAISNASCPPVGKHKVNGVLTKYPATSDAGLRNMAKRHSPTGAAPVTLELADFQVLQDDVSSRFGNARTSKTDFQPNRDALLNRPKSSGTISEGDLVQLAAFVLEVRSQGNESVNCAGGDGTDIHLSVGAKNATEWHGVVAEMIPQLAHPMGWDAATLRKLKTQQLQVLVIGGLTYDNEHLTNDDPAHPNGTQPKRFSLWEIHPITAFYVCEAATCNANNHQEWTTLTTWANAHP